MSLYCISHFVEQVEYNEREPWPRRGGSSEVVPSSCSKSLLSAKDCIAAPDDAFQCPRPNRRWGSQRRDSYGVLRFDLPSPDVCWLGLIMCSKFYIINFKGRIRIGFYFYLFFHYKLFRVLTFCKKIFGSRSITLPIADGDLRLRTASAEGQVVSVTVPGASFLVF